ncbi:putative Dynein regulatory complex subunit 3 [Blattamonas nauphoetae]|uniref:Dynein regulatory complex subunit 3 n=1 Tax=Blattamonas nauphoetae TaxID=2049346 RepID=A0ABQ9YA61_9EUKA|nr:putative Dynein regulatory complex subunit 3 [Blattamonas nauphoetae]
MDGVQQPNKKAMDPSAVIKVINEELIAKSVAKNKIVVEKLTDTPTIILSFKHLRTIENLQGFTKLTVLKLDNNNIAKIDNLTTLVTLEELDLSFNKITEIPKQGGLETLTNLRELSLFANQIKDISPLSKNTSLQMLSVGNNDIEELETIKPLRSLRNLQALTLSGNPISHDQDYETYILAYLSFPLIVTPNGASGGSGQSGGGTGGMKNELLAQKALTYTPEALGGPLLESSNDSSVLGGGGVTTGMISISTPIEVARAAAVRGGFIQQGADPIRTLCYLDSKIVNIDAVIKARELYGEDLAKLEQEDANAALMEAANAQLEKQKEMALLANITGFETFFQEMIDNDQEYQTKFRYITVIQALLEEYRVECNKVLEEFKEYMISQLDVRKKEQEELQHAMDIIEAEAAEQSDKLIAAFEKKKKMISRQLDQAMNEAPPTSSSMNDQGLLNPAAVKELSDANEALLHDLMELEEHRVEQAENILDQYSTKLKDVFAVAKDRIQLDFQNLIRVELREAEVMAADTMREAERATASTTGGAQAAVEETAMSPEERAVLSDKPSLQQSFKNSSEFRQSKIHEKEDEIVDKEKKTRVDMEEAARAAEHKKNRVRLTEIWHLYQTTVQFIQQLLQEESQR